MNPIRRIGETTNCLWALQGPELFSEEQALASSYQKARQALASLGTIRAHRMKDKKYTKKKMS